MQDIIVILEEGNRPYPRCPQCDMFVTQKLLNYQHLKTSFCRQGMDKKWHQLAEEKAWESREREITSYRSPLYQVTSFKYPG